MILKKKTLIGETETAGELHDRLALLGAEALIEGVRLIMEGKATRVPQNDALATYAPKLSKKDGEIDWEQSAQEIFNRIRGFNPWPCCYCHIPDRKHSTLRILKASVEVGNGNPGEVLDVKGTEGPLIACGVDALRLIDVQPEGKRIMTGREYICGHALQIGEMLRKNDE